MLILTVVHICLAAHGRTPCFRAQAIKGRSILSRYLIRMHYPGEVTRSDGTTSPATCWDDYALALDATYETANGVVWSDF
jgi:hypothetical protein